MTYNAQCKDCNVTQEYNAPITHSEDDIPPCPKCGKRMTKAYIANEGGFQLKGGGWFKDGYACTKKRK